MAKGRGGRVKAERVVTLMACRGHRIGCEDLHWAVLASGEGEHARTWRWPIILRAASGSIANRAL